MQRLKVGIILLILLPVSAMGQVSGFVQSIGFENHIRPDSWASMLINLTPETSRSAEYEIHVRLQDMDRDQPIAVKKITLTGVAEGSNRSQTFRMYFMPPPTDGGLPDATYTGSLAMLRERVKVSLHQDGNWICDLPIGQSVHNVDPSSDGFVTKNYGSKLIIAVSDNTSRAVWADPTTPLLGILEEVVMVNVSTRDLPESVLGYDSVDAVIWMDADPATLRMGGDEKLDALDTYVRRGGRLVISQPFDWQKIMGFNDLLPVTLLGVEPKDNLLELRRLVAPRSSTELLDIATTEAPEFGAVRPGPYRFARARAKPGTIVVSDITWKPQDGNTPADTSPYMVRMARGLGWVTWVAQDLGDESLPRPRAGWVHAWDKVFDWRNSPRPRPSQARDPENFEYAEGNPMDVGRSLIETWMDLQSKSLWLISLAILFFIGYWLIAGPGSYTYLATRRKTHLSWFIFALCAVAATGLTAVMKKLVLEGPPEIKHFSVVRTAPDQPAWVTSRVGLYIPRDGFQRIELMDAAPRSVNTITPLMIHPEFVRDVPQQKGPEYRVSVPDATSTDPPAIEVPYRSTLKKLQISWTGAVAGGIQGSAKLVPGGNLIDGRITNGTPYTLRNIYIAFNYPVPRTPGLDGDWVYYWRTLEPGMTIDLTRDFQSREDGQRMGFQFEVPEMNSAQKIRGRVHLSWLSFWTDNLGSGIGETTFDDSARPLRKSLPMMSFFDRLPPMKNEQRQARATRMELRRRGGRWLDMSAAVASGQLVVIAEALGPLPIPMEVEGDKVTGEGLILYQAALPLDRSANLAQDIEQ